MNSLLKPALTLAPSSRAALAALADFDGALQSFPAVDMPTDHVLHGGLYARTVALPEGVAIVGALIQVATTVIVSGRILVTTGDESFEVDGYRVVPGCKGRKQAFIALADSHLTMIFRTDARTVAAAEHEFTADAERLISRRDGAVNTTTVTGEWAS